MKLLSFVAVAASAMFSFNVAADDSPFVKTKQDFVTQSCYVAATEGMDAVKALVESRNLSFSKFKREVECNNMNLKDFAAKYAKRSESAANQKKVELVAKNNDLESRVCIAALTESLDEVEKKFKVNKDYIRCNKLPLVRFVEKNKHLKVVETTVESE